MKWQNTQQFYKSKEWETFRKVVIAKRADADGYVNCAICGKPILKKYDLILHHKKELDDLNVNNVKISLNEDNVECVHFKCHNKIHERFGYHKTNNHVEKKVYIVYGSPCSGKTTWVHNNASENDLIVDMDSISEMISVNDRYNTSDALRSVVFDIRDKLYEIVKYRSGRWRNAFIITGSPLKGERDRLKQRIGADEMIFIDTDKQTCLERVTARGDNAERWIKYINDWFEAYQPD